MLIRSVVAVAIVGSLIACGGGDDGLDALSAVVPASAAECPQGGTTLQAGQDTNRNGVLDPGEVTSSSSVCNGEDGDDLGGPWLTSTADADYATCPWGGTVFAFGKDADNDDVLAVSEVVSTRAVCNSTVAANELFVTWTGAGTDNLWSNPANWSTGERPSPGATVRLLSDAARKTSVNDLQTLHAVNDLVLDGGHTVTGNQLTILRSISVSTGANELALPLHLRGPAIEVADDLAVPVELRIAGVVTGDALVKTNAGTVALAGANDYRNDTTILGGTLRVAGGRAIPDASTVTCTGGAFIVGSDGETIGGIDGSCPVTLDGDLVVTVTQERSHTAPIRGAGALVKRGDANLRLSGASNEHTGPTRIEAGALFVNGPHGASPVTVEGGAGLGGNGNVGAITVAAGGTVEPTDSVGPATLQASGNVVLTATSTFRVRLNGTTAGSGYSRLSVLGNVDLGGATLAAAVGFTPATGNFFEVIQCDGTLTGTFDGQPNGSTVTLDGREFTISYTSTAVRLTKT